MRQINNTKIMSIVHGGCELHLCKHIKSNLRIKHEIFSRENGRASIQVNSLMNVLTNSPFKSFDSFVRKYDDIQCNRKASELFDFSLFIILDVDDCNEEKKECYKSGDMFKFHWLSPYIHPIYNEPNLEATMASIGYPNINNKGRDYPKFFPTNHGDLDIHKIKELHDKLKKQCKSVSNIDDYILKCIEIAESNLI